MPFDVLGGRLENKISQLDQEIEVFEQSKSVLAAYAGWGGDKRWETFNRILTRLQNERASLNHQLVSHRQRDKESGLKY
jgi:hypothetical protein